MTINYITAHDDKSKTGYVMQFSIAKQLTWLLNVYRDVLIPKSTLIFKLQFDFYIFMDMAENIINNTLEPFYDIFPFWF